MVSLLIPLCQYFSGIFLKNFLKLPPKHLTMRMSMRRFTRLTNAFSKKIQNHMYAIALYFMHYNFARPHKTLANPYPRTPAMAAGVSNHVWTIEEIVKLAT